jgi:hypothetical protein
MGPSKGFGIFIGSANVSIVLPRYAIDANNFPD